MLLQKGSRASLMILILFSILNHGLCAHSIPSQNRSITLDNKNIGVGIILDMESWVGRSILSFISMAISDFYALNNRYRTKIILHTRDSKRDPSQALSAVVDLLNGIKVEAIIGPETYLEAKLLVSFAEKAKVPIFSFAGPSSMESPFLIQIKEDESTMAKSIAALVESFKWRNVIFVYEDADHWQEILPHLFESFQESNNRISYRSAISSSATDDQITEELHKIMTFYTTTIIVHMSPSLASRLFLNAKRLGMVSEGYVWIITDKTIDFLQSMNFEVIESMQGALGLRSYIPASSKLHNLTERWYKECYTKYPTLVSKEVSVLAIWAYDTIWALAESFERLEYQHSSYRKNKNGVPQNGLMLLNEISKIRLKGISGEFRLIDGKLVSNGFEIVNIIGNGEKRVGYWTLSEEISKAHPPLNSVPSYSKAGFGTVNWPGGSTTTPRGWVSRVTLGQTLRVGVLTERKFNYFVDAYYDIQKNVTTATGFSVDVFTACINALPYDLPYTLIPFADGGYDDLTKKVYNQEIDAVMGDSTILANRSEYVGFTATYTDVGVGTLARINNNDMWIFLKPLDMDLWLTTVFSIIITGFVVWAIESMDQESQHLPAKEMGTIFWFILSTLFFAQREKLSSNLSKFVVFIWLLVVLILISSYTATLASLLTVEQFQLISKGGTLGFHGGSFVGGVTVSNLNFKDFRHSPYYSYDSYAEALTRGGKNGGADAIVDEIPYIKMFLGKYSADYAMISSEPTTSGFAFIFRKGSPLVEEFSREIAKIREHGTLKQLEKRWFEHQFSLSPQDSPSMPKTLNLGRFSGLFLISGISSALALLISIIHLLLSKLGVHSIISLIAGRNLMATLRYLLHRNAIRI